VNGRARGTIGSLSLQCTKADIRTAATCAEVATLHQERAVADEASQLDKRIAELRQRLTGLRERGGTLSADPQVELLSRLSMGFVSSADVGFGLVLLLAAVIELVSTFGPVVLSAYADATRGQRHTSSLSEIVVAAGRAMPRLVGAGRAVSRPTTGPTACAVIEYMATYGIEVNEIFEDYACWCQQSGCEALSETEFVGEFDHNRHEHQLVGKIQKFGTRYYGLRLVVRSVALPTA
jgi:hypothetical protein